MARVFVVNEQIKERYQMDSLSELGEVIYLYRTGERTPSLRNPNAYAAAIIEKLRALHFDYELDALAIIGRQFDIAILFFIAGYLIGKDIRIVNFNARESVYETMILNSESLPDLVTA